MICKGTYTWGLFHNWSKWKTISGHRWWSWSDGTHTRTPALFQYRNCSRCGKRKMKELK